MRLPNCFDTGINQASTALANWSSSKAGTRAGRRVGFPGYKSRHKAKLSVTFVELNHQLSWLHPSRHGVRLMLPQALLQSKDAHVRRRMQQLVWLHTISSTRRLFRLIEGGRASIQQVTISHTGGRWQVSFQVRYAIAARPLKQPVKRLGGAVGVDVGITPATTTSTTAQRGTTGSYPSHLTVLPNLGDAGVERGALADAVAGRGVVGVAGLLQVRLALLERRPRVVFGHADE